MRVFKSKGFNKFTASEGITDAQLVDVVREMENGLFEADLGGSVYKKRIATKGQGKSGATRNIVAMKEGDRIIFMVGYKKSAVKKSGKEISDKELKELKIMAQTYFGIDLSKIKSDSKALIEVKYE